jgi:Protein of unknown function (DUF1239).
MLSCGKGDNVISTVSLDTEIIPTVHSVDVVSLISDSGVTRYRFLSKIWDMYSNDTAPYWYFPEGIYLEQFDSIFNVKGYIKADTAYYYQKEQLWHVIGNVHIQNLEGWKFNTSELYWNESEPPHSINAIYTDSIVTIDKNDGEGLIVSYGIKSNQSMTKYRFYGNSMEFIVNEEVASPNDSIQKSEIEE